MLPLLHAAACFADSIVKDAALRATSPATLDKLAIAHREILKYEQTSIRTEHLIHGGMYTRTIRLEPGIVMMGSLINRATVLIVNGDAAVLSGDTRIELRGYTVLAGCPGRKQLFLTQSAVQMSMVFPTQAKTVEEAENEIFAEADLLMSRTNNSKDTVNITGY